MRVAAASMRAGVRNLNPHTVHFFNDSWTHDALVGLYYDAATGLLRPNTTLIHENGTILFEINAIGLKGDPVDSSRKLAVVWGDSVVFSIGRGWPILLEEMLPEYQFLNGGIEGDEYQHILERATSLNRDLDISLNLIFLGWHPMDWRTSYLQRRLRPQNYNRSLRVNLENALTGIPNAVLVTIPTPLNRRIIRKDLTSSFVKGDADNGFFFCGSLKYSQWMARDIFKFISERNRIIRDVAVRLQLPLIDLYAALNTTGLVDFRQDFFDTQHPRPSSYARVAQVIYEGLKLD